MSFADADKDWKFTVEVKNLFNEYYFLSKSDVTTPGNLGVVTGVPGMPRTWMASIKRNF